MFLGLGANAAAIGNSGVQVAEFVYDYDVDGGATGFINLAAKLNSGLPSGASIVRIHYYVETAFTSAGSATVAIGDVGSNNRYLTATAFDDSAYDDEKLAALSSGLPHQVASASAGKVGILIGTAALTAGKLHLLVEYVQVKR